MTGGSVTRIGLDVMSSRADVSGIWFVAARLGRRPDGNNCRRPRRPLSALVAAGSDVRIDDADRIFAKVRHARQVETALQWMAGRWPFSASWQ